MIYLDYAATTPMSKKALEVYGEVATQYYGNTSSIHDIGSTASQLLEASRKQIAELLNASPKGIYFTGGGSDSNYLAIRSLIKGNREKGNHLITTQTEHSSVRNTFKQLEEEGYEVTWLSVDDEGKVRPDELKDALREDTVLASIHHANSEIGTIQDVETLGEILQEHGVLFHTDCVQTFGKLPVDVKKLHIDSLSVSSHKIYGPKGVGAFYINPEKRWKPLVPNTSHEKGFRPGTLNTPGIVAFTTAAEAMHKSIEDEYQKLEQLRQRFLKGLRDKEWDVVVEGSDCARLPNIIGFRIPGMEGQYAMLECNRFGVAISTGSACSVGNQEPSKTMQALQRNRQEALEFMRVSLGKPTTEEEIDKSIDVFDKVLKQHFSKIKEPK